MLSYHAFVDVGIESESWGSNQFWVSLSASVIASPRVSMESGVPSVQSSLVVSEILFHPVADAPEMVTSAPVTSAPLGIDT